MIILRRTRKRLRRNTSRNLRTEYPAGQLQRPVDKPSRTRAGSSAWTEFAMMPMDMIRVALCGWLAFYGLLALAIWAMP
jgi:hypothetical protein